MLYRLERPDGDLLFVGTLQSRLHAFDLANGGEELHQLAATDNTFVVLTVRRGAAVPDPITAVWKDGLAERIELRPLARAETFTVSPSTCTSCRLRRTRACVPGARWKTKRNSVPASLATLSSIVPRALRYFPVPPVMASVLGPVALFVTLAALAMMPAKRGLIVEVTENDALSAGGNPLSQAVKLAVLRRACTDRVAEPG
mgnify:CR=1 FL=1